LPSLDGTAFLHDSHDEDGHDRSYGGQSDDAEAIFFRFLADPHRGYADPEGHDKGDGHRSGGGPTGIEGNREIALVGDSRQPENDEVKQNKGPAVGQVEHNTAEAYGGEESHTQADHEDKQAFRNSAVHGGNLIGEHRHVGLGHRDQKAHDETGEEH